MVEWPENVLEPGDDDESAGERADGIEDIEADAKAEATDPISRPKLKHLGVVASGSEIIRPPQNADYPPGTLRLGPIGRAAMMRMVPIGELIELIPPNKYEDRERPENGSYYRGRGL
jgi:hypothetical protein